MSKRSWSGPAALLGAIFLSSAASAQEFAGVAGLQESLAGIRAATAQLKTTSLRPAQAAQAEPRRHVMGSDRSVSIESLSPDGVLSVAPDPSAYKVRGVDISHYQGDIAWDLVKLDGLSFIYIKATEGGDGVDDKFAANWAGATNAGLLKGAYHFYNFCKGGDEQAANFVSVVPPDADALPMTIDLEQSGDCKTMPAKDAFRADLAAFVAKVQAVYGHRPILYVNYNIYNLYFAGESDSYKLWIADTSHAAPAMPDGSSWAMWQYGWHGQVAGIPGEVDLDVFNGTPQTLASLTGPSDVMVAVASLR
ncbi:MAG: GH25 family lysozyme [Elusimicrobiota bacterium]